MLALHVQIQVKPDAIDAFKAASRANAEASRREPGVLRFDVGQQADDPTKFMLYEVYRSPEAHAAHRETAHYAAWRAAVDSLMAVPRVGTRYTVVE
ncbi:MAG TPA: putative quinol monooxygenase [Opitutaceae bacterium]|jgi:quinol monooxygenase YgiN|nr:putative quinol monooxygenase [Opitutaceae bacterium]HQL21848.1 putative quinol monooxygenase [Opitutaceae bacterium]